MNRILSQCRRASVILSSSKSVTRPVLSPLPSHVARFAASAVENAEQDAKSKPTPKKKKLKGHKMQRVSILDLRKKYKKKEKLVFVSAYDYPSAGLVDKAGVDCILVGDSVGMVVMGQKSTIPVTMDEIVYHCKGVVRGAKRAYLLGDMPFGSFLDPRDAVENASRIIKEGGVDGVKLEGGKDVADQVRAIAKVGITVVGHIGLTPQSASALGGFKTQGRNAKAALQLLDDALVLEEAGAAMILIECVPPMVAKYITDKLSVPTIGIGAGPHCSAQIQIFHDVIGMFDMFKPRFSKQYVDIGSQIEKAFTDYVADVRAQAFPNESQCYSIKDEQYKKFVGLADARFYEEPEPTFDRFHSLQNADIMHEVANEDPFATAFEDISWSRNGSQHVDVSFVGQNPIPNGLPATDMLRSLNGETNGGSPNLYKRSKMGRAVIDDDESEWLVN